MTLESLYAAIYEHHSQKADDRCIEDDDRLYAAAGLPPCDRRVGDKAAMIVNCARFIENRCQGGGWATYAELERQLQIVIGICDGLYDQQAMTDDSQKSKLEAARLILKGLS